MDEAELEKKNFTRPTLSPGGEKNTNEKLSSDPFTPQKKNMIKRMSSLQKRSWIKKKFVKLLLVKKKEWVKNEMKLFIL